VCGNSAVRGRLLLAAFALALAWPPAHLQAQHQKRAAGLEAISPSFWDLIDRGTALSRIATGFGFTEGPVWDQSGYLWVSDETLNQIFKVDIKTGNKTQVIALGDPDGNTYDKDHRLLDCASVLRAVIRLSPDGSKYTIVADRFEGKRLNSPNDVVLGPDGAIYFTDPTSDLPKGQKQELPFKGVFRIGKDGSLRALIKDLKEPNGLAFSPDGKRLYVDDSTVLNIWVYDVQPDGSVANGHIFADETADPKQGVPDGMRVDTSGNLYVVGPRGIWVWSAAGKHLGTIVVPEQPANLAWGDAGYSTLYITAETSVYKSHTKAHGFIPYQ
jgi:gluconolactonase